MLQDTSLTPDEIEEIQFEIPDEAVTNESTTFGKVEDHESKVAETTEASTESSLAVNTTGTTEASTEFPMAKSDDPIKVSKLYINILGQENVNFFIYKS